MVSITHQIFLANCLNTGFYPDKNHIHPPAMLSHKFTINFFNILDRKCYNLIRTNDVKKSKPTIPAQLELACELSGARWAAWLLYLDDGWQIENHSRWTKAIEVAVGALIRQADHASWMAGTLSTGRVRSRAAGKRKLEFGCQRLIAMADCCRSRVLLIGADGLSDQNLKLFRLLTIPTEQGAGIQGDNQPAAWQGRREGKRTPVTGKKGHRENRSGSEDDRLLQHGKIMVEMSRSIAGGSDFSSTALKVVDALCEVFSTERAAIFLVSGDGKRLREFSHQVSDYPIVLPIDQSLAGYVFENGKPLRLNDVAKAPRYYGEMNGVRSALAVPLVAQGSIFGVIMAESTQKNHFSLDDERMLGVIASQLVSMLISLDSYQITRKWARNLELIQQLLVSISGLVDEGQIAQKAAELIGEYFNYEYSVIFLLDSQRKNLVIRGLGGSRSESLQLGSEIGIARGIVGRIFSSGESYFSKDAVSDVDYFSLVDYHAASQICIPIKEGNQVIGVINLEDSRQSYFSESDQILIESLAGILSNGIMNARRYKLLQEKINILLFVREVGLDITENLEFDTLLTRIVQRVRELVKAKGAEIGLVEGNSEGIRVQTSINPWYDFSGHFIPYGVGVAGKILETKKPVRVNHYADWPERLWPGTKVDFEAVAGVPLILEGKVIGTLTVQDDDPGREFTQDDLSLMELISQNISVAIQNARLYNDLQELMEAQQRAEAQLIQSERMATAGRLTAVIAHEINNPLQALRNCLDLAARPGLRNEQINTYLRIANDELERLTTTAKRMLDFYRPVARDRQTTDLNGLILRVLSLMENQLRIRNIEVIQDFADDLPPALVVPGQIQQVLLNLILNAMEAMQGGGTLTIETKIQRVKKKGRKLRDAKEEVDQPQFIEIYIRDSGKGILDEDRERIFEPFESTKENGLGLGLSVSYGIVQAHGGNLSLIDQEQPGACFQITIPVGA